MRLLFLAMMEDRDGLTEALGCVLNLNETEELVFNDDKLGRIYQVWSLSVAAYTTAVHCLLYELPCKISNEAELS